jgi:tetraprenyl-beta-curcumene synthase
VEARREARSWRQRAEQIRDQSIREDALHSLTHKRGHFIGAAFFSTLSRQRSHDLLRVLATFQAMFDFLDNLNESHTAEANGLTLHLALTDVFEPERTPSDYYAHHPWKDDDGYLRAFVETCRRACLKLPSYELVRPLLIQEAMRSQRVLALNHLPDPAQRDLALQTWAKEESSHDDRWSWFELSAAAGGQLSLLGLLALAGEPDINERGIIEAHDFYWPLLPLITTMLDSFVDQPEDIESGEHLYVSHYSGSDQAVTRITELIDHAAHSVLALPNGHRHAIVMSCMIGFFLSKDSARTDELSPATKQFARAGGSLTRALLPIMRGWRIAYSLRSA